MKEKQGTLVKSIEFHFLCSVGFHSLDFKQLARCEAAQNCKQSNPRPDSNPSLHFQLKLNSSRVSPQNQMEVSVSGTGRRANYHATIPKGKLFEPEHRRGSANQTMPIVILSDCNDLCTHSIYFLKLYPTSHPFTTQPICNDVELFAIKRIKVYLITTIIPLITYFSVKKLVYFYFRIIKSKYPKRILVISEIQRLMLPAPNADANANPHYINTLG